MVPRSGEWSPTDTSPSLAMKPPISLLTWRPSFGCRAGPHHLREHSLDYGVLIASGANLVAPELCVALQARKGH